MLWLVWLSANFAMFMNDVAAAWLMVRMTSDPVMVALVQTTSSLPVFLLGLPGGALSDRLDKRLLLASTQLLAAVVAAIVAIGAVFGALTPYGLLALVFASGIGLAIRIPLFQAIVMDLVPKDDATSALSLVQMAQHLSRIVAPLTAGLLLSLTGAVSVFTLNAGMSLVAFLAVLRWRPSARPRAAAPEGFVRAMLAGLQCVVTSQPLRRLNARSFLFFVQNSCLIALLPLFAGHIDPSPSSFTILLSAMGVGAVAAAVTIGRWRHHFGPDGWSAIGAMVVGVATLVVAFTHQLWLAAAVMVVAGVAWLTTNNNFTTATHAQLPGPMRARGISIIFMSAMAGNAAGSLLWGQVAKMSTLGVAAAASLLAGAALIAAARWFPVTEAHAS